MPSLTINYNDAEIGRALDSLIRVGQRIDADLSVFINPPERGADTPCPECGRISEVLCAECGANHHPADAPRCGKCGERRALELRHIFTAIQSQIPAEQMAQIRDEKFGGAAIPEIARKHGIAELWVDAIVSMQKAW